MVLRSRSEIAAWAGGWSALLRRQRDGSPAQGPDYCLTAIDHALPDNAQLAVVGALRLGRIVGVWPLWILEDGGLSIATHIGGGSNQEYAGPLADDDEALAAMYDTARRLADALLVCGLPASSPLLQCARGIAVHRQHVYSPVVRCGNFATFDEWLATKSKNFRRKMRSSQRVLKGPVPCRIGRVEPAEIDEIVDWLFDAKCAWARERGIQNPWFSWAHSRSFAKAALRNPACNVIANAVWYEGRPIAAAMSVLGRSYEYFITTYDPEYMQHSPGKLLQAESVKEAIDAGVDFDMRITQEAYKLRWSDDYEHRVTLFVVHKVRSWPRLSGRYVSDFRRNAGKLRRQLRERNDPLSRLLQRVVP